MNTELIKWLVASLFWLSLLISLIGIIFMVRPGVLVQSSKKLNRWISTSGFFDALDRSRQVERTVYRYHRWFGFIILVGASYCLYIFLFNIDVQRMIRILPIVGNSGFSAWLYEMLYYLLICANALALVTGLIILLRPSLLKSLETIANRWIASDKLIKPLDQTHSIPEHILPGNIRLFGLIVLIGGLYIMFNTGVLLLKGI
jgi:hypothetical protein